MKQPPQEGIGRKEKADLWLWGKRRDGKKVKSIVDERGFRGEVCYIAILMREREEFFCFCFCLSCACYFCMALFLYGRLVFEVWKEKGY